MSATARLARLAACASLISLIFLCLLWESVLAPLRPGGSLMLLKALPLLLPLFGILRGRLYTYQWSSLLILGWTCEGLVRIVVDHGLSRALASLEVLLCAVFFVACLLYVRAHRRAPAGV